MKSQKNMIKKSLFLSVLTLFIMLAFAFQSVKADGFDVSGSIFESATITANGLQADGSFSGRVIGNFEIVLVNEITEATIIFDDTELWSFVGTPSVSVTPTANTSGSTYDFQQLKENVTHGIGHNMLYFNNIALSTFDSFYLNIGIDPDDDVNYINDMASIASSVRIYAGDPYEFVREIGLYTPLELLQMGLIQYNNGYQDGIAETEEGFGIMLDQAIEENITLVYDDGFTASGYADLYDLDPLLGWDYLQGVTDGTVSSNEDAYSTGYTDGGNDSFQANIHVWIVPAIIIVLIVGGFITFARMKKEG